MLLSPPFDMALLMGRQTVLPQPGQLAAAEAVDLELNTEVAIVPPPVLPETQKLDLCAVALSELHLTTHLLIN
eukprot:10417277-Heterocapsa_arctica.AAC.1